MREIKEYDTADGKRFRVRYRHGGRETSETFRRREDAQEFRSVYSGGGVDSALAWLEARQKAPTALTFGQWFEEYVDQLTGVSPRTRNDYRSLHRRYFTDLDRVPLTLLTRAHITKLVNDMERAGKSPKTIKETVHLISSCLGLAIDEGHATANPCKRVRLPKQAPVDAVKPRFLTHEEAGRLVEAHPLRYQPLITFLLGTGQRWSEATAQQARHISLDNGTSRVEQAWKRIPGKGFEIGPPKTPRSTRTVNAAVPALAAVAPLLGKSTAYVFTTATGGPVRHANYYTNIWQPACIRAELGGWDTVDGRKTWRGPRIHDTRHTHASWLISEGVTLEAVQDQLGHESILTTRNLYAHLLPALGIQVGKVASAALTRALRQTSQTSPLALEAVDVPD